ncbi:CDP-alcohol phosphatidyltransferase family protein [Streptomyces carpaticus]|uniref:CDP-alcohol phosphatidyltransferase n=3 Tax=Streptomyces TaxID=1883 RepID=A0A1I6PS08_9ACTN|nr:MULTISPECIES: CDP-alcohol phosphatidyltransferase family protein [Streptomyces]QKV71384.1 CDP-alcohol phosphatidyltransferase family protein [Streptomyces harbinensis]UWM51830.1 CDP-alcohol phosphatidyltransferase family protein [Streptomyces carpaticus]SFS43004.1 CDP-alcohol phosphatidyltransferase [Streptomyces harbinensis]
MRHDIPPLTEVRRTTQKKRDAWWTVLLVDPVATPLVRWTALWTRITPNQITWLALFFGLGAAGCFAFGTWNWLLIGALLYHVSFILDCMDGKLARLTRTGSVFGAWLDYVFDRIRVLVCAVALMGGQFYRTDDVIYLWLALTVVFLDMLRYIDALQIFKIRHGMRKQIKARARRAREAENATELAFMEDLLRENPEADADAVAAHHESERAPAGEPTAEERAVPAQRAAAASASAAAGPGAAEGRSSRPAGAIVDLHREFRSRFPGYLRLRAFLLRHRIRTHLVSGIEFQMAVFIIAPALNAVIPVTIGAGVLLLLFELAIIYKLLLSTRDFARTLDSFDAAERQRLSQEESTAEPGAPVPH